MFAYAGSWKCVEGVRAKDRKVNMSQERNARDKERTRAWAAEQRTKPGKCGRKGCDLPKYQCSTGIYSSECAEHRRESSRVASLKYWHRPEGGRHQKREREATALEAKIEEILIQHPDLKEVLAP